MTRPSGFKVKLNLNAFESRIVPAVFTVTNDSDSGTGRRLWKGHPKDLAEVEKIIRSR